MTNEKKLLLSRMCVAIGKIEMLRQYIDDTPISYNDNTSDIVINGYTKVCKMTDILLNAYKQLRSDIRLTDVHTLPYNGEEQT